MRVHKYQLNPDTPMKLPKGAKVLTVQTQRDGPYLWALIDPKEHREETRTFKVIPTGHDANVKASEYIGTFQLVGGDLVFHVFERP